MASPRRRYTRKKKSKKHYGEGDDEDSQSEQQQEQADDTDDVDPFKENVAAHSLVNVTNRARLAEVCEE